MASAKMKGLNKHQRRARKAGERRISGDEIWRYVDLSKSEDPADRLAAAKNLCPCHVRRRIDEVWDALYRMLEDPDVVVRRAAYHTLEDGGRPDDPALKEIFDRAWENETDKRVRKFLQTFSEGRAERERVEMEVTQISSYPDRGKCDFCGASDTAIRTDYDTEIPGTGSSRPGLVCEACDT